MVLCSSSRQITGWGVSLLNSVECAALKFTTLRPNSITAHCIPRQMPKNGMPRSRAKRMASTLPFDPALAEAAGHKHAVESGKQAFGAFAFDQFALNALNANLRPMVDAGMIERFVDRFIRVAMFGVFAHDGDRNFVLGIAQAEEQIAPIVDIGRLHIQAQAAADEIVEPVFLQAERHFVDREILVLFFDDRIDRHIAEQRDFFAIFARHRTLGAANQHIGLNADLPQQSDGVLRRLGLQLAGRFQIRHEREMDVQAVFLADIERKLADRFQKRLAFDIADRAADFGDDDIDIVIRRACE